MPYLLAVLFGALAGAMSATAPIHVTNADPPAEAPAPVEMVVV